MNTSESSLPKLICDAHPGWISLHEAAWRIAASRVEHPALPGWKPQLCCMPDSGIIWLWDSCFMQFFAHYGNGTVPVMANLDNLYRLQREDGFIAMAYTIESEAPAYGERINPPLLAWTELNHWKFSGDDTRIPAVLPRLIRYFDWIKANRRRASGLYWFEDSGSSGMDNSPRSGYAARHLDGSDICHVDLAAQQALSAKSIAAMARHVGDTALAERFGQEHSDIVSLLDRYHWDSKTGFYYDVFNRNSPEDYHNFLNHKTAASFWPLLADCCNGEQTDALLQHLLNPEEFWTLHPVATLSKDDPNFHSTGGYWLGGVWAPINYMLAKALKKQGRPEIARRLAVAHLEAMHKVFENSDYPGIWEAYAPGSFHPSTRKPLLTPKSDMMVRPDFVGWSGLGPIALLIEDILGFEFDAVENRIIWNLQTDGRHGIENLQFAGGRVSLIAAETTNGSRVVSVITEKPVTIRIRHDTTLTEQHLAPGEHDLKIK